MAFGLAHEVEWTAKPGAGGDPYRGAEGNVEFEKKQSSIDGR